ncbi:hypothetical protein I7I50_05158 [Histoplasma capsulatum G186AR]|nr:hypothetical protein I7I52_03416 [Histoplasma capsulatum]QSS75876.1 hypothetical protein I7I50_05158 [Histoplasma capsulatum G186AR]
MMVTGTRSHFGQENSRKRKDAIRHMICKYYGFYRTEDRKINDAKLYLDARVKQKWLNFVAAYEKCDVATPLTFDDMLSHLEMQINDPENRRRMASQRFQDAYQKEWQSIREFSKYLEDWEYYLPAYTEEQRMDNLRSKVLPEIRKELLQYPQYPQDYDELLRRMQTIEENMPERRRAIRKGKPVRFTGNRYNPNKPNNRQNERWLQGDRM